MTPTATLNHDRFWELWQDVGNALLAIASENAAGMDSHRKGMRWQQDFVALAEANGLTVSDGVGRSDFTVNGKAVQCKAIEQVLDSGCVCIDNMRPVRANGGRRGYLVGEYDVMALRHKGDVYLIPADRLAKPDGRMASRVLPSEFDDCIDNWSVFDADYVPPEPVQRELFA